MKLILIRHGEVEDARPGLSEIGHDDPALNETGLRQAQALALELQPYVEQASALEALYTSPLRAAAETAEAISAALKLGPPVREPALATITPEVVPEEGAVEVLGALQERAWSLIEDLRQRHEEQSTLLLVSHELTIRTLVCRALSMSLREARRFGLDPASMTTIEFRVQGQRERTLIANLNETCHLESLSG